jgi:hypothetical protein
MDATLYIEKLKAEVKHLNNTNETK